MDIYTNTPINFVLTYKDGSTAHIDIIENVRVYCKKRIGTQEIDIRRSIKHINEDNANFIKTLYNRLIDEKDLIDKIAYKYEMPNYEIGVDIYVNNFIDIIYTISQDTESVNIFTPRIDKNGN